MAHPARLSSLLLAVALTFGGVAAVAVPSPAVASDFQSNTDGADTVRPGGSTNLNYRNGHGAFNLNVWVVAGKGGVAREDLNSGYSITMYNSRGQVVWSAVAQHSRTYYLGSNVTKVKVTPSGAFVSAAVHWRR